MRGFEGLGLGDVKLAGVAGIWIGPQLLAPLALVAAPAALVAVAGYAALLGGTKIHLKMQTAFGSFIAPAIFLA